MMEKLLKSLYEGTCFINNKRPEIIIYRARSQTIEIITGPVIGRNIQLEINDLILLYPKELIELQNKKGEKLGRQKLSEILKRHFSKKAEKIRADIFSDLMEYFEGIHADDITYLVAKKIKKK